VANTGDLGVSRDGRLVAECVGKFRAGFAPVLSGLPSGRFFRVCRWRGGRSPPRRRRAHDEVCRDLAGFHGAKRKNGSCGRAACEDSSSALTDALTFPAQARARRSGRGSAAGLAAAGEQAGGGSATPMPPDETSRGQPELRTRSLVRFPAPPMAVVILPEVVSDALAPGRYVSRTWFPGSGPVVQRVVITWQASDDSSSRCRRQITFGFGGTARAGGLISSRTARSDQVMRIRRSFQPLSRAASNA